MSRSRNFTRSASLRTAALALATAATAACYPGPVATGPTPAPAPMPPTAAESTSREDSARRDASRQDASRQDALRDPARANGAGPVSPETESPPANTSEAGDAAAGATRATRAARKTLIVPVEGVQPSRVRDTFRAARGARRHNALDIMAPRGTPVIAADDGTILRLSSNPAGGITIYQHSADGQYVYYYAHLQGYRKGLKAGDEVRKGDVLAYVGTTGNAPDNVPHLHFQVMRYRPGRYWDGEPVNAHGWLVRPNPFIIGRK